MYLLDTDVCVSLMRRSLPALAERVGAFPAKALKTSVVTAYELEFGARRSREPEQATTVLRAFLENLQILPFDLSAALHAGQIRAELTAGGNTIGAYDLLIAGHARSAGATLVTGNVREFSRVRELTVESWTTG
jgi:tRNA(fMet)-specific endonuclease VapC